MWAPSFLEVEEVGDKTCEDLVEAVQVQPHQHARADHDRGGLPGLLPVGEVDLGQLAADLADEPARPAERALLALNGIAAGLALGLARQRRGHAPPTLLRRLTAATCHRASESPCAAYASRTNGSTWRTRSGRASCASICWSGSYAACTLDTPAERALGHLWPRENL